MSIIKKSAGWLGKQMVLPYTRLFGSVRDLGSTTAAAVNTVKQTAQKVGKKHESTDPIVMAGRKIDDGRERFEFYYHQRNWTPPELKEQASMLAKTQGIYMLLTVLALAAMVWQVAMHSGWGLLAIGGAACAWTAAAVFCGCTIKTALMLAQLDSRELFEIKQFMGRDDFWFRLLMPWSRSPSVVSR